MAGRPDYRREFMQFCGFRPNESDFMHRWIIDPVNGGFTPCWEMLAVAGLTIPLLFFTVISLCYVARIFPRYDSESVHWILTCRLGTCVYLLIALLVEIVLASTTDIYVLPGPQIIEYGGLFAVWSVYAAMWAASLANRSWSRSRTLMISYWLANKAFILVATQRWIHYGFADPRTWVMVSCVGILLLNGIGAFIEWRIHATANSPQALAGPANDYVTLAPAVDEEASLFSRLFFLWTNPLITKGTRKQLNRIDDVFELPPSINVESVEQAIIAHSPSYYTDGEHFGIGRALLRTFGLQYFLLVIPRLIGDLTQFVGPIMLHLLVTTLESDKPSNMSWAYAGAMIATSFLSAMFIMHYTFQVQKMSYRFRAATVTSIFDKLMKVPLSQIGKNGTGNIINLVTTDVDRIVNFCDSFHAFWSLPVQLVIAMFLLYREIGIAFLAGIAVATILIPVNKWITVSIGKRSELMMTAKDQRVKLITETMGGMRAVKMSSWEEFFEKRIGQLRRAEMIHLKARKYLDALCVYLWAASPILITVSILVTYTLVLQEKLTAAKVFTSLALVNILIQPLNAFPWVINGLVEARVSMKRLNSFFSRRDIEYDRIYSRAPEGTLIRVEKASFSWTADAEEEGGEEMGQRSSSAAGSIIGIAGPVGSGKSTLLLGLLGETSIEGGGTIGVRQELLSQGIAYVGQHCWLTRGSVRENILCGLTFDAAKYEGVIHAACLTRDIKTMPGGDSYEISENGATLSGGQRVRVMLARALYQDNDVFLLDDPFASLDRAVADHIWREAVMKSIKRRGKLAIVASHDESLLALADDLIVLGANGDVLVKGPPGVLLQTPRTRQPSKKRGKGSDGGKNADIVPEDSEDLQLPEFVVAQEEEKQEGTVRVAVYGSYASATGGALVASILVALVGMQLFKNTSDWWLTRWTSGASNGTDATSLHGLLRGERQTTLLAGPEMSRSVYFLTIYSLIAGANTVFTLARAFLFAKGGVVAATRLHKRLLKKLLKAPLSWWDRTPAGRVINRMTADIYTVDDSLPFQLNIFLACLVTLIGSLVVTLIGLPTLGPLIALLFLLYYFIQRFYRMTTVELKRLSSLSKSPFISALQDALHGMETIRAHRFVERTASTVRDRLTGHLRAEYSSLAATQWRAMRLSMIAVAVVSFVAIAAIVQHRLNFVDSGLVGLAVAYALGITNVINGLFSSFIETEKEMVSVERIQEYIEHLPEEGDGGNGDVPSEIAGRIDLDKVSVRYESYLPMALNEVSLHLDAGHKVAIVGRTGSGKSTLFQALLRACPLDSGRISIDGVDVASLPTRGLRKIFGVVPQSPFLFSGTLAENLAVDNARMDRGAMAHIVRVAQLESLLARIGGLDGEIEEGGKNLSAGERQIVSLCRLLLTKPKIVLIDEATAHMDDAARKKVFSLLNACLPLCTLLSIVHRPHSLNDYDLVIRMDAGRVVSCLPPSAEDVKLIDFDAAE